MKVPENAYWSLPPEDSITTKFGFMSNSLEMELQEEKSGQKLAFKPHGRTRNFISVGYDIFTLTASAAMSTEGRDDMLYGTTQSKDFLFRFHFKKLSYELFFQQYQGYFLGNTGDVIANYNDNDPRLLYPELKTQHYGFNVSYNFSPETYQVAIFDQSTIHSKSGGAWLINIGANNHAFDNPNSLVPTQRAGQWGEFEDIHGAKVTTVSAGGGGGYALVYHHFFLAGQVMFNLGSQWQYIRKSDGYGSDVNAINTQTHAKLGAGYNGQKFIASFIANWDQTTYPIKNVSFAFNTVELSWGIGWRW